MQDWAAAISGLEATRPLRERLEAVLRLHDLASETAEREPPVATLLPGLLADGQEEIRRVAVSLAALVLPPEDAERVVAEQLADPFAMVRMEAAGQLADMARPSVRSALARALEDPAFAVRFEGARGMAALHHSAGLEVLVEGLGKADFRFRALGALGQLGDERARLPVTKVFRRWFLSGFERTQAAGTLAKLGEAEGARHLLERAGGRWHPDRPLAVELCGEVNAPGALPKLTAIVMDPKDDCRGAAARGLGRLGDPASGPLLISVLADEQSSDELRLDAAEGLCLLKHPDARAEAQRALPLFLLDSSRADLRTMMEEYSFGRA